MSGFVCSPEKWDLEGIRSHLKSRIFGQDHVIDPVIGRLLIYAAGLHDPGKPNGSFLFLGPTGVGKTELAKELARCLELPLIRFDMSEYADDYSYRNLIGSGKGLVGYGEGGLLTNAVMENPRCVLLLDEIEKAHPAIYNTFLQVLDYARLHDSMGNVARFNDTIIIMTSNLGEQASREIGFGNGKIHRESVVNGYLAPEFRNRIDTTVRFEPLERETMEKVVRKFIEDLVLQLRERSVEVEMTDRAVCNLVEWGGDPAMGGPIGLAGSGDSRQTENRQRDTLWGAPVGRKGLDRLGRGGVRLPFRGGGAEGRRGRCRGGTPRCMGLRNGPGGAGVRPHPPGSGVSPLRPGGGGGGVPAGGRRGHTRR